MRHLTGVDLNKEMAKEARDRGCYDRIVVGDAECILHEDNEDEENAGVAYDFVFACDMFAFIGDLRPMFNTVRRSLEGGGGTFAFSAEIVNESLDESNHGEEDAGFVMQSCARFAHKRWYIRSLLDEFGFEATLVDRVDRLETARWKGCVRGADGAIVALILDWGFVRAS